jgi:hypothetical protein
MVMMSPLRSRFWTGRAAVDGGERVGRGGEQEAFLFLKFQNEVLIPDAVVFELQIVFRRATDAERKTAGNRLVARLFSGKDVELDHQKSRRGTTIWSPG